MSIKALLLSLALATLSACSLINLDPSTKDPTGADTASSDTDISDETGVNPLVYFPSTTQSVTDAAGAVTITVKLNQDSNDTVTANYTVSGTASNPDDHDLSDGTVTFTAGDHEESISLTVSDDSLDEADETIIVTLSTATGAGIHSTSNVHTITITDDDAAPTADFSAASQSVAESVGTATVTVSLSAVSGQDITVPYTVSGTASNPDDHDLAAGSVSITAGSASGNASITVVDDSLDEDDETVILTMGTPTNATAGTTTVHTATITDNDATPTVTFSAASQNVNENEGTVTVTTTLSAASGLAVTVPFTIGGTATNPDDHDEADGNISITAGSTSGTATFTITDDALDEATETVVYTMGSPTNATQGATTVHTINIADNDALPTVQYTATSQSVAESVGTVTVTATLDTESGQAVTAPFTISGTAGGSDHDEADGNISITAGNLTGDATFTVTDDTLDEDDETVIYTMGSPTNAVAGVNNTHTVTITDNDPIPTVSFSASTQNVAESVGTVTVTATPSATSGKEITVPYTVSGTASSSDDHNLADGNITITAEAANGSTNFTVTDDSLDEDDETVIVTMGTPTNATQGATTVQTVTITDNDATPTVTFTAASQSNDESATNLTVTAQLSAASGLTVSVPYTMSGTATDTSDYTVTASPVTITAGDTTTTITITIVDDTEIEQAETVIVTMGSPTNATQGATTVHTATINTNDQTITVNNAGNGSDATAGDGICETVASSGTCTLRAAIEESNAITGDQTISIPNYTINLGGTKLEVTANVTITGTSESGTVIDAQGISRAMEISGGASLTMSTLTIQNGSTTTEGGNIYVNNSTLSLSTATVKDGTSTAGGGNIFSDGASSSVTIDECTISGGDGDAHRGGGIDIETNVAFTLTDSTISGNSSRVGGGINVESGAASNILRNLFYNNTATTSTAGAAAIWREATVLNNTFYLNNASANGGTLYYNSSGNTLTVKNNTFFDNDSDNASGAGAIFVAGGTADLTMNIFDDNTGNNEATADACSTSGAGVISSSGYNLSDTASSDCNTSGTGDVNSTNATLGALADNGGPTQTLLPGGGSAAIDTGNNGTCPSVDQRSLTRPDTSGGAVCDKGAVEVQ